MCSPVAEQIIDDVVTEFEGSKKQFTAKDITDEVKGRLRQDGHPFERHNDLKTAVHNACSAKMDASWDKTLVQLPGIKDAAYLYHPLGTDPQDYVKAFGARGSLPAGQFAATGVNTPAGLAHAFGPGGVAAPALIASAPAGVNGRGSYAHTNIKGGSQYAASTTKRTRVDPSHRSVNKSGRLIVARCILASIGYNKQGQEVRIYAGNNNLTIPANEAVFAGSNPSIKLHVDVEGRIRINKKNREALGLSGTEFKIEQAGQAVQVQPA